MDAYFDAHAHLQMMNNLPLILKNAQKAGIQGIICNATHEKDWMQVLSIAQENPHIYVALGIHPWYMDSLTKGWENRLADLLAKNPHILIGEIGIDKCKPNLDLQEQVFRTQLELACHYKRPAIVHCVKCWDRLLHIYKSQRQNMPSKILSHSHHGNAKLIPELIDDYNMYFSYSAILIPDNHPKVQECLKATPLNRMLVESDSPDLAPEPASIIHLIKKIALLTGYEESVLKQALFENAKEFMQ